MHILPSIDRLDKAFNVFLNISRKDKNELIRLTFKLFNELKIKGSKLPHSWDCKAYNEVKNHIQLIARKNGSIHGFEGISVIYEEYIWIYEGILLRSAVREMNYD